MGEVVKRWAGPLSCNINLWLQNFLDIIYRYFWPNSTISFNAFYFMAFSRTFLVFTTNYDIFTYVEFRQKAKRVFLYIYFDLNDVNDFYATWQNDFMPRGMPTCMLHGLLLVYGRVIISRGGSDYFSKSWKKCPHLNFFRAPNTPNYFSVRFSLPLIFAPYSWFHSL